jgi:hypothetical protein
MKELTEGIDFYYNDDGLIVLTEKYHLDRGYCCGSGCRHCPYHYDRVPEPRRSQLLSEHEDHGNP